MFDQLVKRSNAVWVYSTGCFAEDRSTFLCHLNERGHGLHTLRQINKFSLVIAERVRRSEPNGVLAKALKASWQEILPWRVDGRAMENVALHPRIAV